MFVYYWLIELVSTVSASVLARFRPKKLPNATDRLAARYFTPAPGMRAWLHTDEAGRIEAAGTGPGLRLELNNFLFLLRNKDEIAAYDIEDDETANEFNRQLSELNGPTMVAERGPPALHSFVVHDGCGCCVLGDGDTRGEALLWAMVEVVSRKEKGNEDDRT